ncbi:putative DNA-binding protein [Yersinia frederiksenii]|uniref:ParB/RepB/Spo0J family partition protein n=1 Tax=Yersinia TaxID=629 RepID=UPI0005E80009|nr:MULTISPECIES: ParB/RepB/Spo0J family partition protein [Yersinia]EKN3637334.1 ParB/RepB/Spo0J family partition protein [Yersinia enterocolitica]CNI77937.1 putative DNA-binding protein [Yersinia frederiksenii]ELI8281181.1 ParB/RepB/Spo0J family partition protein [Yersinia enterocolitica]MCB5314329.1 ParB/RepB/Spo0J family partition protein [Yersinia intermedia]MCB5324744.1 ParB/RepB/Spo0J family partition protein [Yersinia intermedia]
MSITESKAKTAKKASSKAKEKAVSKELVTLLESTPVALVPFSQLVDTELNTRIVPHTDKEIRGLVNSIKGVGILQNLIVIALPDGLLGVVGGGGRKKATALLVAEGLIDADQPFVPVKVVPRELAVAASMTENGQRKSMHPAEQIIGFRTLSEEGNTPTQIGGLLGYGARHVQRMLKLAGLAPAILDSLARDDLSTEHCHVLALEDSHERQLQVLEMATERSYNGKPQLNDIRNLITASEVRIADSRKFAFVGASAFADGQIRRDLFSEDNDGYVDRVLLETHVTNKLEMIAHALQDCEGWAWCLHRESAVSHWGVDAQQYVFLPEPTPLFTDAERARTEALTAALEQTETHDDEYDIQQQIEDLDAAVVIRSWTAEQKAQAGVVVSFERGEVCIQRGVMVRQHDDAQTEAENTVTTYEQPPEPADEISLPLLTKMSAERTLAVQATLMQQREKAVALLTWTLCLNVFSSCTYSKPAKISLTCEHYSLTTNAPEGKNGQAYTAMMQEKDRLSALLPEGWARDFTTFFTLNGEMLLSLLGFCVACSIDGTQTREYGRTSKSPLDKLEVALGFHLRDWWQPGSDNFFSHMKKPQIVAALNEAGLTGAASDAEKMKKGDAADLAETMMARTRWVPVWMKAPDATERPDPASDTDNPTAHAA